MALRPISPQATALDGTPDSSVRAYIDNVLTALIRELSLPPFESRPSVTLQCRADPANCIINPVSGALEATPRNASFRTYSWPGTTAYGSWKFSTHFSLKAHELIEYTKNALTY